MGTHPDGYAGSWFNEVNLHELHNFTTCAVVGGSSSGKDRGADIDANEAVFRFNDAPTIGFEAKVHVVSCRGNNNAVGKVTCVCVNDAFSWRQKVKIYVCQESTQWG